MKGGVVAMLGYPQSVDKEYAQVAVGSGARYLKPTQPILTQGAVATVAPHYALAGYTGSESALKPPAKPCKSGMHSLRYKPEHTRMHHVYKLIYVLI